MNIKRKKRHRQRKRFQSRAKRDYYWRKEKPGDVLHFPPISNILREEMRNMCSCLSYLKGEYY